MRLLLVLTIVLAVLRPVSAQTSPPPHKQVDIGAGDAPLSDKQREDLAAAARKHNYAAEKAVIDQADAEHPRSWELMVMAGRLAYIEKQPRDAVVAFQRADKIKPLSESDRLTLALAEQFTGQLGPARTEVLALSKAFPKNPQYPYLLGRLDVQTHHPEDAVTNFRKAIALDPGQMRAWEEMGRAQEALGLTAEARKTYEGAAARNRLQTTRWEWSALDYGVFLRKTGELDEAGKLIRESLEYNPRFAVGHYQLGQLLEKQGKDAEAITEYKFAVVHDPTLRPGWLALGGVFTRLGMKADADKAMAVADRLQQKSGLGQQSAIK
jgi:tetratricopeptide (TPR) repeat protein